MKIEILDKAREDFLDGFRFYEKQREGLGRYFVDSLIADIESLRLYAGVHSRQWGYYRTISRRFPFTVYYQIEEEVVQIHAVLLTCRRNPAWIQKRLIGES